MRKHQVLFQNCWHIKTYDKIQGQVLYRNLINGMLKDYRTGYQLSDKGEILHLSPSGLESLCENIKKTEDPENIDSRIQDAISKYKGYSAKLSDKKDAIRCLGDVLEYLRKNNIKLNNKDDSDLFQIINGFDIRHHNQFQQGDYDKEAWYDWMFYTFLSSINLLLKLKDKKI